MFFTLNKSVRQCLEIRKKNCCKNSLAGKLVWSVAELLLFAEERGVLYLQLNKKLSRESEKV